MAKLREAKLRHSRYYAQKLSDISRNYDDGRRTLALSCFDEEWEQIEVGRRSTDVESALRTYLDAGIKLLRLRKPPSHRINWLSDVVDANQLLFSETAEVSFDDVINMATAHRDAGDVKMAIIHCDIASGIAVNNGDRRQEAIASVELAECYLNWGETIESIELYRSALGYAERFDVAAMQIMALWGLGRAHVRLQQHLRAIDFFNRALITNEESVEAPNRGNILLQTARSWRALNQMDKAKHAATAGLALAEDFGDQQLVADIICELGYQALHGNEHRRALSHCQRAGDLHRQLGDSSGEACDLLCQVRATGMLGLWSKDTIHLIRTALQAAKDFASQRAHRNEYAKDGVAVCFEEDDLRLFQEMLHVLGQVYAHLGERDNAAEVVRQAAAIAEQLT